MSIRYSKIDIPQELNNKYLMRAAVVGNSLEKKYSPDIKTLDGSLFGQLPHILYLAGGNVSDKVVLDLGCGSSTKGVPWRETAPQPWLCRALHMMDARSIGIDIGELTGEEFEHYRANLLEDNPLSAIPDNSVDIVNMYYLITSPIMDFVSNTDPKFQARVKEFREHIIPEVARVLKTDGVFLYSTN